MKNGRIEDVMGMAVAGKDLDLEYIASWITDIGPIDLAIIEKSWGRPFQNSVATFNQGKFLGEIYGILATLKIPYQEVRPQAWKKVVLAGTDRSKQAAIDYVRKKYPGVELRGSLQSRKPHEGIVEAICLAEYGWLTFGRK